MLQRIDMGSPILFLTASFLAIMCALTCASDPSPLQDFCVADPTSSVRINGLACLDPELVHASHFSFSGLHVPGNTSNPLGLSVTDAEIPGLNTLGLSISRGDFASKGVAPPHTHPRATEVITVLEGTLLAGFVTSNPENKLISKTLQKGDVFVFPHGLLHFVYNVDDGPASVHAVYSSQNNSVVFSSDIFGTHPIISDEILAKAFQVDECVISELRPKSFSIASIKPFSRAHKF